MKLREILSPSFRDYRRPHTPLVVVATDSDFCRETVDSGVLTAEQMAHAAARYRLGKSKSGRCIFWMIDEAGKVRDGRIGNEWVSAMMKAREPVLLRECRTVHCLYGLHLIHTDNNGHTEITENTERVITNTDHTDLTENITRGARVNKGPAESTENTERGVTNTNNTNNISKSVCIVDDERTAVILSELFPECLWMATMYPLNLNIRQLEPLRGRHVVLYPHTDSTMSHYVCWLEIAESARQHLHMDVTCNRLLEDYATEEQKKRKIDLVGFLTEHTEI